MAEYKYLKYTFDEINRGLAAATAVGDLAPSRANALKNQVSNEIIQIDDCSPFEHEMDVKVRGKNLCPETALKTAANGGKIVFYQSQEFSYLDTEHKLTITAETINTSTAYRGIYGLPFTPVADKTYTFSCEIRGSVGTQVAIGWLNVKNSVTLAEEYTTVSRQVTGDRVGNGICFYFKNSVVNGDWMQFRNVQIEEGSTATSYAPYIEDISTVKIKQYGKNLIDIKNPTYKLNAIYEVDSKGAATLTRGDLATGVGGTYVSRAYWEFGNYDDFVGKTFVVSLDITEKSVAKGDILYIVADFNTKTEKIVKTTSFSTAGTYPLSFTIPENTGGWKTLGLRLYCESLGTNESTGEYIKFKDLQLEVGTTATEYEPYIEPIEYSVNVDGVVDGITSQTSVMTLMGDTPGAILDVEYNQDVNKWRNKISTAAIMLGGL